MNAPAWFRARVLRMAVSTEPDWLWRALLGLVTVTGLLGTVMAGTVGGILINLTLLLVLWSVSEMSRDRADRLVDNALPALLDRLASGVRAGVPLPVAFADCVASASGPLHGDMRALVQGLGAGLPLRVELERWRRRRDTDGVRLAVVALSLSAQLGGRAGPLEGVASTLRDRLAVEHEVRAVSSQARASAAVMIVAPVAFLAASLLRDPDAVAFFFGGPLGLLCAGGAVLLDLAGAWWMFHTLRSAS